MAISARPRAGLKQSLTRKGIPDEVAETVLDRLTTVGLIDDEAYAAAFVRTKHRDRALGRAGLGQELRRKGVDPELVSAAVAEIDPTAERIRARALVDRRLAAAMAAGPLAARRRLAGLLARRGYAPAVAYEVVGQAVDAYVREMPADAGETAEWSESDDPFGDAD
nr:regulatory protein RecX [Nakamurella flavida]